MAQTAKRKRNVSRVWNPALPATLGNPKKRRKTVAKAKKRRRNPLSAATSKTTKTVSNPRRKRGGPRRKYHARRTRRNPARRAVSRRFNPAAGMGILPVLLTAGGVVATEFGISKVLGPQSGIAGAGIKAGAGFLLRSMGRKLPLVGKYAEPVGNLLIGIAAVDIFRSLIWPQILKFIPGGDASLSGYNQPLLGDVHADGMGNLVYIDDQNPAFADTW